VRWRPAASKYDDTPFQRIHCIRNILIRVLKCITTAGRRLLQSTRKSLWYLCRDRRCECTTMNESFATAAVNFDLAQLLRFTACNHGERLSEARLLTDCMWTSAAKQSTSCHCIAMCDNCSNDSNSLAQQAPHCALWTVFVAWVICWLYSLIHKIFLLLQVEQNRSICAYQLAFCTAIWRQNLAPSDS